MFNIPARIPSLPASLYVDWDSIYRCEGQPSLAEQLSRKAPQTQFGRAMKQLGVELIMANSPQAKWRVERMNGVLKDRLVKDCAGRDQRHRKRRPVFGREVSADVQPAVCAGSGLPGGRATERAPELERSVELGGRARGARGLDGGVRRPALPIGPATRSVEPGGAEVNLRTLRNWRVQLAYRGKLLKRRSLPTGAARRRWPVKSLLLARMKTEQPPAANHPWRRMCVGVGRKFWNEIKADGRAVRLVARDFGRPSFRSGLSASRATSQGN
jgi:hypothetical protein